MSTPGASEAVVLCEGFHDRAFWAGWLEYLGCSARKSGQDVFDPAGKVVKGEGQFGFWTRSNNFIRVVPCGGRDFVLAAARFWLANRATGIRPSRLVLVVDPDAVAGASPGPTGLRQEDLEREIRAIDASARANADDEIELDGGATKVMLVRWELADDDGPGVPAVQTLERLVCAAICAAYPGRGPAVKNWLDGRPLAPLAGPKEHAWSHMAGWYADRGCQDFYKSLWQDDAVVRELRPRLEACGAWRIAALLCT